MVSMPSCTEGGRGGERACRGTWHALATLAPAQRPCLFGGRHGAAHLLLQTVRQWRGSQALGQQRPQVQDGGRRDGCACQQQTPGAVSLRGTGSRQQVCQAGRPRGAAGRHLQLLRCSCSCLAAWGAACRLHRNRHGSAARRCCGSKLDVQAAAGAAAGQQVRLQRCCVRASALQVLQQRPCVRRQCDVQPQVLQQEARAVFFSRRVRSALFRAHAVCRSTWQASKPGSTPRTCRSITVVAPAPVRSHRWALAAGN